MLLFVIVLHILLCFLLMLVILLQPGKGGDVGAAFGGGGGSSTLFGPRGPASLLSRATTIVAVLFMFTSITLAIYSNESVQSGSDVQDEIERLQEEEDATMRQKMKDLWQQMDDEAAPEADPAPATIDLEQLGELGEIEPASEAVEDPSSAADPAPWTTTPEPAKEAPHD